MNHNRLLSDSNENHVRITMNIGKPLHYFGKQLALRQMMA